MIRILLRITNNKSKVIRFGVPLEALIIVVLVGIILAYSKAVPIASQLIFQKKQPTVTLKTEYNNPFNKESQYVNPFEKYKNPFVVNR